LLCAALTLCGCSNPPSHRADERDGEADAPFTVREVTLPYRTCGKPQRVGGSIYAQVSRGPDKGSSIIRYDLDSSVVETVTAASDPDLIGWFVVNDRWLVWSVEDRLLARPRLGGATQLLSEMRDLYAPALHSDLVAWDDLSEARAHQIVMRDLRTGDATTVAPVQLADLYNNFPAWDGSRLVWTDVRGETGVYRSYDASSGQTTDHTLESGEFRYPGYAQPADKRIYSINFARVDEWDWGVQQVGYYSMPERRFVPLVPAGFVANSLDVSGGLVAIVDSDQRLTLRRADDPHGRVYRPIGGRVDFVQASADGTMIAWREATNGAKSCRLFVIEPK